jgi:hypothetical protein
VALRDASGAEDRDTVVYVAQCIEAGVDLGADAVQASLVLPLGIAGDAQQVLVAFRPWDLLRSGQSAPSRTQGQ